MPRPPRIQPTQALASATSLSGRPPEPISMPIVIKKGTAIRLYELMPLTICWQTVARLRPWYIRQKIEDSATEYAIGKRSRIMTRNETKRIAIAGTLTAISHFLLQADAADLLVDALQLKDDHRNAGQRHREVHPETGYVGHRNIGAPGADGGGVLQADHQHHHAQRQDGHIGQDVQEVEHRLGDVAVERIHPDVLLVADGDGRRQNGHVAHQGQDDLL